MIQVIGIPMTEAIKKYATITACCQVSHPFRPSLRDLTMNMTTAGTGKNATIQEGSLPTNV
jgi:hypothetical protein